MPGGIRSEDRGQPTLVVTGATGRLGRDVVEAARQRELAIRIVTRDTAKLPSWLAGLPAYSWDELPAAIPANASIIHLAARNNDAGGDAELFQAANVEGTERLARVAAAVRASHLVFASSVRAIAPGPTDHYGTSKRAAEVALRQFSSVAVTIVRLPALHRGEFAGRLSPLGRLPRWLQPRQLVGSLRPELDRGIAAEKLLDLAMAPAPTGASIAIWSDDKDENRWYRIAKRAIDLTFALSVALLLSWLLAVIWALVRLDSRGPGLFVQERVGQHGRVFKCYKFRTMQIGTPSAASHLVSRASVTRVGNFLRKSKLDELPQIVNLLKNEMSLVGPRPCLPTQSELVQARSAAGLLEIIPGITGWAQINDVDMSDVARLVQFDQEYRARRSLPFDLKILIATVLGRGRSDRAGAMTVDSDDKGLGAHR